MLLFIGILSLGIAAYLAGEVATYPARQQRRSVQRAAGYGRSRTAADGRELLRFRERVVSPAILRFAALALKLNPKTTVDSTGKKLLAAGLSARVTPTQFLAAKGGLAVAGVLFALLVGI